MQLHSRDFHSLSDSQTPTQLHSHPVTLMPTPIDAHGPELLCHIHTLSHSVTDIHSHPFPLSSRTASSPRHTDTHALMHTGTRSVRHSHTSHTAAHAAEIQRWGCPPLACVYKPTAYIDLHSNVFAHHSRLCMPTLALGWPVP